MRCGNPTVIYECLVYNDIMYNIILYKCTVNIVIEQVNLYINLTLYYNEKNEQYLYLNMADITR